MMYIRDILPGVSATQLDGFDLVMDLLVFAKNMYVYGFLYIAIVAEVEPFYFLLQIDDDNRGKWLYRGYLVGDAVGNFAGRWRDTVSPAPILGYEGSFAMSRRR